MFNPVFHLEIVCDYCKATHRLPLDASGHFNGKLPCGPTANLQVNPEKWREIVAQRNERIVH